jgi:hypothetical protein
MGDHRGGSGSPGRPTKKKKKSTATILVARSVACPFLLYSTLAIHFPVWLLTTTVTLTVTTHVVVPSFPFVVDQGTHTVSYTHSSEASPVRCSQSPASCICTPFYSFGTHSPVERALSESRVRVYNGRVGRSVVLGSSPGEYANMPYREACSNRTSQITSVLIILVGS